MPKNLLTNSLIFFSGTMVLSVFNYLYNSFMGRLLGPADYSIIGSLLAFIAITTIPTNAVATVAMRFSAYYHARNQDGTILTFFRRFSRKLFKLGILAAIAIITISPWLTSFLHLPSAQPVILIAPILILAILLPLNRGMLQGLQNFTQAIINQNIDPILKLTLGVILVKLGFGINGAIGAIIIGAFVAYLASYLPLRTILKQKATPIENMPQEVKDYSLLALATFLLATLLMNIDVLLVKHYMLAYEAGLYAALSTMGKIVLFVTTPIVSVMFPMISDLQGRHEKHYRILLQSIVLVTLISLTGVVGYYLFPELIITILYGTDYLAIAPLLGLFGIVMTLFSMINLWINYFLSIGNRAFIIWLVLSVIIEVSLLFWRHDSFASVIRNLLTAMIVGFTGLTGYYLYLKRQQIRALITGQGFSILQP